MNIRRPLTHSIPVYKPARRTRRRYRLIYGGAGSSKSVFTAQDCLDCIRNDPSERILVVRKVKTTIRHSTFALFIDIMQDLDWHDMYINKSDMTIIAPGGGSIIHAGLDDVNKLKSITGVTKIWVEEATEIDMADLGQLDLRLRGIDEPRLTLTFNPTYEANVLFNYIGFPIADLPERSYVETADAYIQHTTFEDNKYVGDEYLTVFRKLAAISESFRDIYMLGKIAVTDEPDQLIKWAWVKAAFQRETSDAWSDGRQRAGIDVGRYGSDPSIMWILDGYAVKEVVVIEREQTVTQGKRFGSMITERGIPAELVGVDAVGLGVGVVDTLWNDGIECVEIISGASALEYCDVGSPVQFPNIRAQMWWWTRRLFETGQVSLIGPDIGPEEKRILQEDLLAPRYRYKGEQMVEVEPKEGKGKDWGLRGRLGRSPDYGDALVMGLFVDRYVINGDSQVEEPDEDGIFTYDDEGSW